MEKLQLVSFEQADALAEAVAAAWLDQIEVANRAEKQHCVALSGGRITLKLFASMIEQAKSRNISVANIRFFWADERCVPPNDSESNFAAADKNLFQPLGVAPANIHRIHGEDAPEKAAQSATEEILRVVPHTADGLPVLDLIFLGMGEDGHVASLFPREPESAMTDRLIFRAIDNSPKPPPNRVTLGYPAIAAAREVWVLASGAGKEVALRESLNAGGQTPLARVIRSRKQTKVFTDINLS